MRCLPYSRLLTAALILAGVASSACADTGLPRHETPTPPPSPEPERIHWIWTERVCGFEAFEAATVAWDEALDAKQGLRFEALKEELLRLISFDLQATTSGAVQTFARLHSATTADTWWGAQGYEAPPGVAGYELTLFEAFRDFEPVLIHAEAETRRAQSLDDLEAIHATVRTAQERMMTSIRGAVTSLSPETLVALYSSNDCRFILPPVN